MGKRADNVSRSSPSGVTANAGVPQRRKYTTKACNECRRRRAKCNGASPRCSRCADRGIECQYRTEEDRRRPAPKSYVDMLRCRINDLESVLQLHAIDVNASIGVLRSRERRDHAASVDESPASSESLIQVEDEDVEEYEGGNNYNRNSSGVTQEFPAAIDGKLSSDKALNFEQDGEIRYFGPASGRLNFKSWDGEQPSSPGLPHGLSPTASNISLARAQVNRSFADDDDNDSISEEMKIQLIELYFEWFQPWCQVIDKRLFYESRASRGRYHSPLLENCILALGSRYHDAPELRSNPEDPNTAGLLFFDKAEVLLYYDLKWPTITTIQALSLLNILHVAVGADAAGWLRQGMAIRLALDMGLNMDAAALVGSNLLATEDIELRRQLYWALYCDDKLSAIYTGRSSQASVQMPSTLPGHRPASARPSSADQDILVMQHRALIGLSQILEKIILSLYSPRPSLNTDEMVSFLESCMLDFKTWNYDLPPRLRIERNGTGNTLPSCVYILHMLFNTAQILLGKPFLAQSRKANNVRAPTRGDGPARGAANGRPIFSETLLRTTANNVHAAAKRICSVARAYKTAFGSFRRSATTATHCTLSATLALLQQQPGVTGSVSSASKKVSPSAAVKADIDLCLEVLNELSASWCTAGKLRAGLMQLVHPDRKDGEHEEDGAGHHEKSRLVAHDASRPEESVQQPLDYGGMDLENLDIGQSHSWLFGQDVNNMSGPLPSDYQAFDTLSFVVNNNMWNW